MRRDFLWTRAGLVLVLLVASTWWFAHRSRPQAPLLASFDEPPVFAAAWEAELSTPEIRAAWRERRVRLAETSRLYRQETDPERIAALRGAMEDSIAAAERHIQSLRLARARQDGDTLRVRRLQQALNRIDSRIRRF